MIYKTAHIVIGDEAAKALAPALEEKEYIFVFRDLLNIGPLQDKEKPFSGLRSEFWQKVTENETTVDDLERLMTLSSQMNNHPDMTVWLWMADWAPDVCTYYFMLHYLKKHAGRVYVVNIAGLPFITEDGKLYFPANVSQLQGKEAHKARRLARKVSPAEWETDGEEWKRLLLHNDGIRELAGNKKLQGYPINHYDELFSGALEQNPHAKLRKIVSNILNDKQLATGDLFLEWRARNSGFPVEEDKGKAAIPNQSS